MSDYSEAFYKLEGEYLILKAQRDGLLEAAKDCLLLIDEEYLGPAQASAIKRLETAIAKAEGRDA